MPLDVTKATDQELQNLVDNHRRAAATNAPLYLDALGELERRKGNGLDFDKSYAAILNAAKKRQFLSYKDLADASGADWQRVHYSIGRHLGALVEYAHRRGWPLLSAIVVNKPNVKTGEMEPETLRGFIGIARYLEIPVVDEEAFLRSQQTAVFDWAARLPDQPDGTSRK